MIEKYESEQAYRSTSTARPSLTSFAPRKTMGADRLATYPSGAKVLAVSSTSPASSTAY
jgi:hypothetical protein